MNWLVVVCAAQSAALVIGAFTVRRNVVQIGKLRTELRGAVLGQEAAQIGRDAVIEEARKLRVMLEDAHESARSAWRNSTTLCKAVDALLATAHGAGAHAADPATTQDQRPEV